MRVENDNTDSAILAELCQRLTQARLARNLKQADLALASGLSKHTVERMEAGRSVQLSNFIRVLRGLKLAQNLDPLIPESGPSPLAEIELRKRERRRASSPRKSKPATDLWTWGDKP